MDVHTEDAVAAMRSKVWTFSQTVEGESAQQKLPLRAPPRHERNRSRKIAPRFHRRLRRPIDHCLPTSLTSALSCAAHASRKHICLPTGQWPRPVRRVDRSAKSSQKQSDGSCRQQRRGQRATRATRRRRAHDPRAALPRFVKELAGNRIAQRYAQRQFSMCL